MYECLNRFTTAVKDSFKTLSKNDEDALITDIAGGEYPISSDLYRRYSDNLRKAVDAVPMDDTDLQAQWHANVSRFAAYKAFHATQGICSAVREDGDIERGRAKLHAYNRYQAAEYNTTVTRARTGKQWLQFCEPDNLRLFPNMQWLPSRSADPREEHMPFYNRIWPKDDPFWQHNQPGTLWNCKCDWQQTDEPPTAGNPANTIAAPGLTGNPAATGEIFSDTAPYFRKAGNNRKERDAVEFKCQNTLHKVIRNNSKSNELLSETCFGEINGVKQQIHFEFWGISETSYSMIGNRRYWLKNEILNNPSPYFEKAVFVKDADVDLTHNTGHTLRLKRKFKKYYYLKTQLANGEDVYLNIVLHQDGNYYLYTISKNLPEW